MLVLAGCVNGRVADVCCDVISAFSPFYCRYDIHSPLLEI